MIPKSARTGEPLLPPRAVLALLACCLSGFIALSVARARADRPANDEAWFASPSLNLLRHGQMGTTILEERSQKLPGLSRRTYWVMPLYPVALAGWFSVVPFDLFAMRAFSIAWCVVAITLFSLLAWRMTGSPLVTVVTAFLLSTDFVLVRAGATGRMDAMCATLGFAGVCAYLLLREARFSSALAVGSASCALAWFTHPLGLAHLAGLIVLVGVFDHGRLRARHLPLLLAPHVLVASLWGWYISAAPAEFVAQFSQNASNRFNLLRRPELAIWWEWRRYFGGAGESAAELAKWALLVPYGLGLATVVRHDRCRGDLYARAIALLASVSACVLVVLDSRKVYLYSVHVVPYLIVLTAFAAASISGARGIGRSALLAALAGALVVQLAGTTYTIARDSYHREFLPVAEAIARETRLGKTVMGTATLAFVTGFDGPLQDDASLGAFTGAVPDVVVVDETYQSQFAYFSNHSPAVSGHIRAMLARLPHRQTLRDYEIFRAAP